jgi:hypothetical protein
MAPADETFKGWERPNTTSDLHQLSNADPQQTGDRKEVYRDVRALRRGLELVAALVSVGWARPSELARLTNINRSSIYHLLDTLVDMDFVSYREDDGAYVLSARMRSLADGVRTDEEFVARVQPHLQALTAAIK